MVSMLSSVVELPPKLRMDSTNLISHFLIGRKDPNLETFFKQNQKEVSNGLNSKIYLPNIKQHVKQIFYRFKKKIFIYFFKIGKNKDSLFCFGSDSTA
jgi:hypothetical protein